jgi:hypothetical protein
VIVALNGMAIGNNLMVSPPQTTTGVNVIAAARAAAVATGDAKKEDKKDESKDDEKQAVAVKNDAPAARSRGRSSSNNSKEAEEEEKTTTSANSITEQKNKDTVANEVAAIGETDNPYVKKLFKDKSETQQIGWMYESLSPNSRNYAAVIMPLNTQALVVVTQDMQTNSWNFSAGKPQGQIVINQNFR